MNWNLSFFTIFVEVRIRQVHRQVFHGLLPETTVSAQESNGAHSKQPM